MDNNIVKLDIQPKWKTVEYSRNQIIKAGKTIRNTDATEEETEEAIKVIDNWRAAHAFPLHVIYIHLRRMGQQSPKNVIVAERLKRLESITNKLKKEKTMNLWTMQDLGGCRVIVPSVEDVYEFACEYEKSRKRHIKLNAGEYDYIKKPKSTGYRSLHVVYKYHSDHVDTYNRNMLIEIQFRTHIQHLWATAVETMGLFTKEAIKSGQGSEDVQRFFVLTSALLAKREGLPIPPNVIDDEKEIISEIEMLDDKNHFLDFLSGIRVAVDNQIQKGQLNKSGYCILILNYNTKRLLIK